MKSSRIVTLFTIGLVLSLGAVGCKKKPQRTTPLPGQAVGTVPGDTGTERPLPPSPGTGLTPVVTPVETTPPKLGPGDVVPTAKGDITGRPQDRTKFAAFTVYFDFDRSVIKSSEAPKIEAVANQFKAGDPNTDLLIEGHCDERGTTEYNRALGERRALAIREYLVRAGVNPEKIHTVSFGEDKPVAFGHDEAAWAKNRRGEFVLILPR